MRMHKKMLSCCTEPPNRGTSKQETSLSVTNINRLVGSCKIKVSALIQSCMDYCCHVQAGAPSCYLELLDKLQKQICRTVDPPFSASLEPLDHHRNVAFSLILSSSYYLGRCSSKLAELVSHPCRSTHYSDRLHDFSVTIPRCYKDAYVNNFFPCTAKLWNSLPIECFP